jgi:hypothetical protein
MLYDREDVEREAQVRLRLEPREGFDNWLLKVLLPRLTDKRSKNPDSDSSEKTIESPRRHREHGDL